MTIDEPAQRSSPIDSPTGCKWQGCRPGCAISNRGPATATPRTSRNRSKPCRRWRASNGREPTTRAPQRSRITSPSTERRSNVCLDRVRGGGSKSSRPSQTILRGLVRLGSARSPLPSYGSSFQGELSQRYQSVSPRISASSVRLASLTSSSLSWNNFGASTCSRSFSLGAEALPSDCIS